jgi:hypothetical protein
VFNILIPQRGILTTHQEFGGRATSVFNAILLESGQDLNGHGTHVMCRGNRVNLFVSSVQEQSGEPLMGLLKW